MSQGAGRQGASDDFLSRELVKKWGWNVLSNATLIKDAFGETVTSEGSVTLEILLISESGKEIRKESSFLVIESPIQIILGRESIKEWELVRHFPSHFCLPREKTDFEREDIEEIGDGRKISICWKSRGLFRLSVLLFSSRSCSVFNLRILVPYL